MMRLQRPHNNLICTPVPGGDVMPTRNYLTFLQKISNLTA
jgi:hypothetical protein